MRLTAPPLAPHSDAVSPSSLQQTRTTPASAAYNELHVVSLDDSGWYLAVAYALLAGQTFAAIVARY